LKNFVTIDDLLKAHTADTFRMMLFMHHYRSPLDYTDAVAEIAEKNIDTLSAFAAKLEMAAARKAPAPAGAPAEPAAHKTPPNTFGELEAAVYNALDDDFNTPNALAVVFAHVSKIQPNIWNLPVHEAEMMAEGLRGLFATFGIALKKPEIPAKAHALVEEREQSRGNKQFEQSDRLRKEINALGYDIEDTARGPFLWPLPKNHN
jgi:cysteinyl-tRNA synthetase